ncbi:MAG: hypothetical protein AAF921_20560 [Cyanobacteria bacterium P01_D01_bin.44]
MNLFDPPPQKISPTQLQQLKAWVYEALALDAAVPVSISQLKCTEPGCPPLETVIAVMTQPPQTYKIHRPAAEIEQADIANVLIRQGAGE